MITEMQCISLSTVKRKRGESEGEGRARERKGKAGGTQGGDSDEEKQEGEDNPDEHREAKRPKREGKQGNSVAPAEPEAPQQFAWEEDTLPIELVEYILDYAAWCEDSYMDTVLRFVRQQWRDIVPKGPDEYFVVDAISAGSLSVVQWAVGQGCPLKDIDDDDWGICEAAVVYGNVEALKWLSERGVPFNAQGLRYTAAQYGSGETLKWLSERGIPFDAHYLSHTAAAWGNVSALEWMVEAGHPIHPRACLMAAKYKQWDTVERLASHGCGWERPKKICYRLAQGRRLDLLRLVLAKGCPVDDTALCVEAAKRDDLDALKWLRAGGFDWNGSVCFYAAMRGNLEMFKWAVHSGCPCDIQRCARRMPPWMLTSLLQVAIGALRPAGTQPLLATPACKGGGMVGVGSERIEPD